MHLPTQIRLLVLMHVILLTARCAIGSVTRSHRSDDDLDGDRSLRSRSARQLRRREVNKSYRNDPRQTLSRLEDVDSGEYEASFSRATLKFDNDRSGYKRYTSGSRMSSSRTSQSLQEAVRNLRSSEDYRSSSKRSRSADVFIEPISDSGVEDDGVDIDMVEGPAEKKSKISRIKSKSRNVVSSLNRFRKSTPGKVMIGSAAAATAVGGTAAVVTVAGGTAAAAAAAVGGAALLC
jgi:hypothetical protein